MNLLELTGISKAFDGLSVICDLALSFQAGSVTAVLGDNGAGKSTLLRIIAGVYPPDRGEIKLAGSEISSLSVRRRRELGIEMVYQDLALVKHQDVVHNLFLGRELHTPLGFLRTAEMQQIAKERLSALGVTIPDSGRPAGKLSGGQQQSIAIARALLFNPKVLLLDEPTAALGAREVEQVLKLIRLARDEGKAIIFVSHRFNDVFEVADRIVVLKQGRVFSDEAAAKSSIPEVVAKIVS